MLTEKNDVKTAILKLKSEKLSSLPEKYSSLILDSVKSVQKGLNNLEKAILIENTIQTKANDYKPTLIAKDGWCN